MSNLLTKAFLLLAFLGAANAVKCHEIINCEHMVPKGFLVPTCQFQKKRMECIESAVADCKLSHPNMDVSPFDHFVQSASDYNCQGNDAKGGAGTATNTSGVTSRDAAGSNEGSSDTGFPENPTCHDFPRCIPPDVHKKLEDPKADYTTICRPGKHIIKCFNTALADCKANFDEAKDIVVIQSLEEVVELAQRVTDKHCNEGGGITQTTWLLAIFSALALIVARLL